jgi:hypothetical protein
MLSDSLQQTQDNLEEKLLYVPAFIWWAKLLRTKKE